MGCWDETCVVTRRGIRHGDEVFLLQFKKAPTHPGMYSGTYQLLQQFYSGSHDLLLEDVENQLEELLAELNTDADADQRARIQALIERKKVRRTNAGRYSFAAFGEYDDYGGLELKEQRLWRPNRDDDATGYFFVHASAFRSIVEWMRAQPDEDDGIHRFPTELEGDIFLFVRYCHVNRIQLYDPQRLTGIQHYDRMELDYAQHLREITAEVWGSQDARVRSWDMGES